MHVFLLSDPRVAAQLVYTIVACAFKRKSSVARFALNITAETQASSARVERLSRSEPEARLCKRLLLYH